MVIDQSAAIKPPSQASLVAALTAADRPLSIAEASKWISRERGLRLSRAVLAGSMNELCRAGTVTTVDDDGQPRRYVLAAPGRTV